jgi:Ala-tRNA(Pro) deacylase
MTETSSKTPASRETLYAQFDALGIVYKTHDHAPVFTVEESAQIKADLPGGHTKNLFLKDKSGALFLVCALAETQVPVNKLHKVLGCKRLSFGKPDLLLEYLGVTPGSVTVFSVINDPEAKVGLVLDKALLDHEIVNFHPLKNDATTAISSNDLLTFVKAVHSDPLVLDFAMLVDNA